MGNILKTIIFALSCMLATVACTNKECYNNQSTLPLAGFYSMQTAEKITVDSLTVYGIGACSIMVRLLNYICQCLLAVILQAMYSITIALG